MTYQLTASDLIRRVDDDVYIPPDRSNGDYLDYLKWLDEGNTPLPYVPPTIIDGIEDLAQAKKVAANDVRYRAHGRLSPTDWVVVREMESGVAAPEAISLYRTALRAAAADKVATIEGKQKLSTLADYLRSEEFASWPEPPTV